MDHLTIRNRQPEDEEFLFQLFMNSRPDLLGIPGMDAERLMNFLYQQYVTENKQMNMLYQEECFKIIEYENKPIGQFYVHSDRYNYRILAIAIVPEYRRMGIGRYLLEELIREASLDGKKIVLQVAWFNGEAKALYHKLGFEVEEDTGVFCKMKWQLHDSK